MKTHCILLVALLSAGALVAQEKNALASLKTTYEAKRAELTAARDATVNKALAAYQAELGTLLTNVKQQGNLDYVLAIEAEQKRLETDASAPAEPAAKEFTHLRRVQWATRQAEDKANAALAEQSGKLRKQYTTALEKLEKDLVAANRIEEAKAARAEREGVEGEDQIEILSGPPCEIVEYQTGGKVYPDMRRLWVDVPKEFAGYHIARCALKTSEPWVVRPVSGDHVYALVPEGMADQFQDWETVHKVNAAYGADYHFVWRVMRKDASAGSVTFPRGLAEAAFPFCRKITGR